MVPICTDILVQMGTGHVISSVPLHYQVLFFQQSDGRRSHKSSASHPQWMDLPHCFVSSFHFRGLVSRARLNSGSWIGRGCVGWLSAYAFLYRGRPFSNVLPVSVYEDVFNKLKRVFVEHCFSWSCPLCQVVQRVLQTIPDRTIH